jgi:hypothetical protein
MPWEVNDAVKQRWEFVKEWESEDWGIRRAVPGVWDHARDRV